MTGAEYPEVMNELPSDPTSDDEHEVVIPTELQWRVYEQEILRIHEAMDPSAEVTHDAHLTGRLSGTDRQVDVLIRGTISGQELQIAIECKRYARKLGIGAIDEFAGKLLDLGVERGVLFTTTGFTEPATLRASGAIQPRVLLNVLDLSPPHVAIDVEDLVKPFTGFGDCPNENCYTGDIDWSDFVAEGLTLSAGICNTCGTWGVKCSECDEVVGFFWDENRCYNCNARYELVCDPKDREPYEIRRQIGEDEVSFRYA
jgi:hypothetical protein